MAWKLEQNDVPGVAIIATMLIVSSEQLTGGTTVNKANAVERAIDILRTSREAVYEIVADYTDDSSKDEDENDDE